MARSKFVPGSIKRDVVGRVFIPSDKLQRKIWDVEAKVKAKIDKIKVKEVELVPTVLATKRAELPLIEYLSQETGISVADLDIATGVCGRVEGFDQQYKMFEIPKKSGGVRQILAPSPWLKQMQRMIDYNILTRVPLHEACHGFRQGRSIMTNASQHIGTDMVLNIDLKDFFPTITAARVFGIFYSLGYDTQASRILTKITTYGGALPQGAPTSPALANIACRRLDSRLSGLCDAQNSGTLGLSITTIGRDHSMYTRYADDLTFSGSKEVKTLLPTIRKIIEEEGFFVSEKKLHLARKGARQEVTGLTVNDVMSTPRKLRKKVRAMVHKAKNGGQPFIDARELGTASVNGYISYINMVNRSE